MLKNTLNFALIAQSRFRYRRRIYFSVFLLMDPDPDGPLIMQVPAASKNWREPYNIKQHQTNCD